MIASCGESLVDFVPDLTGSSSRWTDFVGGSPYNVARGLGRLGIESAFVGAISTDLFGEELLAGLESSGVATDYVVRLDRPSTLSFVRIDDSDAEYAFYNATSADRNWPGTDNTTLLAAVDALHFGSNSLVLEPGASEFERLMGLAKQAHVVSFDPNVRPQLVEGGEHLADRFYQLAALADIVKLSADDIRYLEPRVSAAEMAGRILSQGAALVFVTCGQRPTIAFTPRLEVTRSPKKVHVVDTIGAGDGFMAGLLASLSERGLLSKDGLSAISIEELDTVLDFALRVAAAVCTRRGAEMPTKDDLAEIG
ncbi:MAG TPA: carbohydrate kinase [Acidimicrobiales bacterium]|nr:carbohydrate kinase [Acidimicrobiales bacterium]